MDAPRPTSELAADVREALAIGWPEGDHAEPNVFTDALAALDALVARITDLEARAASWQASCEAAREDFEEIHADREAYIANAAGNARRAAAAEAQVEGAVEQARSIQRIAPEPPTCAPFQGVCCMDEEARDA